MHACLNVDEIVRFVVCELIASEANATAVSLACCCKDFQELVLDALWETQDRLTPLLKCFPQGVWEERVSQVTKLIFSTLKYSFDFKVPQENPDKSRVDYFSKTRSEDEEWTRPPEPGSPSPTTPSSGSPPLDELQLPSTEIHESSTQIRHASSKRPLVTHCVA